MIYQKAELYNAAELIDNGDGSVSWCRVPMVVRERMDRVQGKNMAVAATGVELRFVLHGEKAVIRMAVKQGDGVFHVYRGGIQGYWDDHEVHKQVRETVEEFEIRRSNNLKTLKGIAERSGDPFDCEVVRVIFDRGEFKLFGIEGDIEPPKPEQLPEKTLLAYGSSITHGSNSIDQSHSWVSVLAHNLGMDARNLGMAGSCCMEPEVVDYIASEGEARRWDIATLELGINILHMEDATIYERVRNTLSQIAGRNPEKQVFVISPFYHCGDDFACDGLAEKWRRILAEETASSGLTNVTYVSGMDVLDHCRYMSADEVHPNIYGVARIAERLTEIIQKKLN